ncbi:peptide chain release factor N(5)-glutamine methyltransferase [Caballeronia concitans]|uniref:Release factor glutamine methyltransferase n=1 Tax=Caballeronia concitans TaxID=1777133 RepID=A0A658R4Z6_9BURK|nr:peptide chain release factor N(5)-glutamine methyltransferase [Caballeronia concitans]KIG09785.1 Protein-(glutamine-N5) methyltransferase, release factor-specific [Burkholderia sp. MR1]SAL50994.1 HemK family modification methylase [Caballeronia concitans]
MTTAADLLRTSPLPALETRVLLMHVLGWRRTELITRDHESLDAKAVERFEALAQRRLNGEPIAQLTGKREFFGLEFEVSPDVLIPRPETELLVETALEAIADTPNARVLDLGTGTGAIAISIAHARPDAGVWAIDRSPAALDIARRNARNLLGAAHAVTFIESDWTAKLDPSLRFEVIVSNPPYIAKDDPHLTQGDLRFEPRGALTDDADGLSAIRIIIDTAPLLLAPGGALWIEHGYDQADAVRHLLTARGFTGVRSIRDLAGIERTSGGAFIG